MTDRAKSELAKRGYDPVYGARPLKRAIQKLLLDPLATDILQGKFISGDAIEIDLTDEGFSFRKI